MSRAAAFFAAAACLLSACSSEPGSTSSRARQPTVLPSATSTPADGLSFAVIGDFGTGDDVQRSVAERMCKWRREHRFDIAVTTGDNIYPDGDPDLFKSEFFRPYRCLRRKGVSFHATLGNHDIITDNGDNEVDHPKFGMGGHD